MENSFITATRKQFEYYKMLGEKSFAQLTDEQLFVKPNEESNSVAIIVTHLWGNMLSRWTDFLTSDGEKDWRNREAEFEIQSMDRKALLNLWEEGWQCLFRALDSLTPADLGKIIYIRNQGHTVTEAILRQLAHYPYHVGQIVFLAKWFTDTQWQSLSIPKGQSAQYNQEKFNAPKEDKHFTDDYLRSVK